MLPVPDVTPRPPDPQRQASPRRLRIRRGLDLPIAGRPDPEAVEAGPPVARVALLGADAPGVRPALHVEVGDRVRLGQTLFVDRKRPALRFASPGAGVVEAVERGPRRRLEAVVVRLEGEEAERFEPVPANADAARVREAMLASGLWSTLRTRPFSRIPDPDASPHALFVTALESEPGAPDAARVVADRPEDFARGVVALAELAGGPLYVCARPGAALPEVAHPRVERVDFAGPHPAGLPGTHIHRLSPASPERVAWHLGYADALDLGHLLATGRPPEHRVVALSGPAMARPRLVRTRIGASTEDLVRGALHCASCRVISGSVLSGRRAAGWEAYLGRLHTQVCAVEEPGAHGARAAGGWWLPGFGGRARRVLGGWGRTARPTAALGGRRSAFFPLERMDRVFPFATPLAPLLRALLVGDTEAARGLGALELAEEDLALVSFLCPAKLEYGALLRRTLEEIERQEP